MQLSKVTRVVNSLAVALLVSSLIGCTDDNGSDDAKTEKAPIESTPNEVGAQQNGNGSKDPLVRGDSAVTSDLNADQGFAQILDLTQKYVDIIATIESVEDFEAKLDQLRENGRNRIELGSKYGPIQTEIETRFDTSSRSKAIRVALNTEIMRIRKDSLLLTRFEALLNEGSSQK